MDRFKTEYVLHDMDSPACSIYHRDASKDIRAKRCAVHISWRKNHLSRRSV